MKKDLTYKYFQTLTKDKDKSVLHIIQNAFNKTQSMFYYKNLPKSIPQNELEELLQKNGSCFITKINNVMYALQGDFCGTLNEYNKPSKYLVTNTYLNLSKEFDINKDGVLFKNDFYCCGLMNIVGKYAVLLTDANISLNTCAVLTRLQMLISASDDDTKESAEKYVENILQGDFSIIGENAFLDGVKLQNVSANANAKINELIELTQYYKANLLNEIGLNANWNAKRERLNETEILLNNDDLLPFIENMLNERKKAVEKINEMYNLNVSVDLKSSWKTNKENNDKTVETLDTKTEIELNETNETKENLETKETKENLETEKTDAK